MVKYKIAIFFRDIVMHPFTGSQCKSFTVEATEDQIDGDGDFFVIGNTAYPVHNITCLKREIIDNEVQRENDDQANG